MKRFGIYFLAGWVSLAGATGCRIRNWERKPQTSVSEFPNPHPDLFYDTMDSLATLLEGDFVRRYRWSSDQKGDQSGIVQMDSISSELGGKDISGYKTEISSLAVRVEDDTKDWATDSNGDGTKDYIGLIDSRNKLAITGFKEFHEFATNVISYDDAVQNAEFFMKENITDIDDFKVFGIGNSGLYYSLPGIGRVRADVTIRYKDSRIDVIIFDTFSMPVDVSPGGDLDKLSQYFSSNSDGVFANTRVSVFTDNHTTDVKDALKSSARDLTRSEMDKYLNLGY